MFLSLFFDSTQMYSPVEDRPYSITYTKGRWRSNNASSEATKKASETLLEAIRQVLHRKQLRHGTRVVDLITVEKIIGPLRREFCVAYMQRTTQEHG